MATSSQTTRCSGSTPLSTIPTTRSSAPCVGLCSTISQTSTHICITGRLCQMWAGFVTKTKRDGRKECLQIRTGPLQSYHCVDLLYPGNRKGIQGCSCVRLKAALNRPAVWLALDLRFSYLFVCVFQQLGVHSMKLLGSAW